MTIPNINTVEKPHQKLVRIQVFSTAFDEISAYSRRGILIIKFEDFPGFQDVYEPRRRV